MTENNRPDPENNSFDAENASKKASNTPTDQPIYAPAAPEYIADKKLKSDPTSAPGWERNTLEKLALHH